MSKSDAGKLGYEKAKHIHADSKRKRIDRYNSDPVKCRHCKTVLKYEERRKVFCNSSCSAKYYNEDRKICVPCRHCSKPVVGKGRKYCNAQCQQDYRLNQNVLNYETGKDIKLGKDALKRVLIKLHGYKCNVCSIVDWNSKDLTLEMEHRDGHADNNEISNLCLLCPNCHSQTPTYKSKNIGNGRHARRVRYAEGKSY